LKVPRATHSFDQGQCLFRLKTVNVNYERNNIAAAGQLCSPRHSVNSNPGVQLLNCAGYRCRLDESLQVYVGGIPLTRRWLIPQALRPRLYWPHPTMSAEETRLRTQSVWDTFYGLKSIWVRSQFIKSLRARLAFLLISKIYRQMYADTGIATDSARVSRSVRWARLQAKPCQRLFAGVPMPDLEIPTPSAGPEPEHYV